MSPRRCRVDPREVTVAIAADPIRRLVLLSFHTAVDLVGLDPERAREVAATLIDKADRCERTPSDA